MLIGFTGKIKAGKTECCKFFELEGYKKIAFADPLKEYVSIIFDIPLAWLYDAEKKDLYIEEYDKTIREILQVFGTEAIRKNFGFDFWVNKTGKIVNNLKSDGHINIVIEDVRFIEEAEYVKNNNGILVSVTRSSNPNTVGNLHESENTLPDNLIDFNITNDSSLSNLRYSLIDVFEPYLSLDKML